MSARAGQWLLIAVGLSIAWGLPELDLGNRIAPGPSMEARLVREGVWWGVGSSLLAYVVFLERRPLSSIGIRRPTPKTFLVASIAAVVMLCTVALSYAVIFPLLGLTVNQAAVARVTDNPGWLIVLMVARAGVIEEILYRGYPIERIREIGGSNWWAAVIPTAVFVLAHLSVWGAAQLIVVLFGAVLLAILYIWRRDLICNMVAHFLVDLVAFLGAPGKN